MKPVRAPYRKPSARMESRQSMARLDRQMKASAEASEARCVEREERKAEREALKAVCRNGRFPSDLDELMALITEAIKKHAAESASNDGFPPLSRVTPKAFDGEMTEIVSRSNRAFGDLSTD
ncbi:hypothetical protein [Burkholderia pseudomallei]|uniref:hypothetical protein n=1 Tax=Burkholderia pseudomallei TaxID=28450 RepID=UPI001178CC51|nr:hypothetical protein [Burkholderia pseudomallei]